MGCQARERDRGLGGGSLSLAFLLSEYGEAIDYDLMTRTRFTLDDLGGALSARALLHFLHQLPVDSSTWAATHRGREDESDWASQRRVAMLLADISDQISGLTFLYEQAHSKNPHSVPKPKPIKRPGIKDETKRYGHGAIPIKDFDAWWEGGTK
jgi:hypothetical protein